MKKGRKERKEKEVGRGRMGPCALPNDPPNAMAAPNNSQNATHPNHLQTQHPNTPLSQRGARHIPMNKKKEEGGRKMKKEEKGKGGGRKGKGRKGTHPKKT